LLFLTLIVAPLYIIEMSKEKRSPIVIDDEGNWSLSPERKRKLEREIKEMDNAVQYSLRAREEGYFPCYTCPDTAKMIFLYAEEVWKYGVTRKGEHGRYPSGVKGVPNLTFVPEFEGHVTECLKEEKRKIYHYPLLPEARKRLIQLYLPPGNKIDH
jgi:hypothetical protein